jgi:hypothetical protein
VLIAQAVVNEARARHKGIFDTVAPSGSFGSQKLNGYCATTQHPNRWEGAIAGYVLTGQVPDLAKGARNFVHPSVWGNAIAGGRTPTQGGQELGAFETIMRRWHGEKAWIGPVPSIDPYYLLVLRNERDANARAESLGQVLELFRQGIAGRSSAAPGDPDALSTGAILVGVVTLLTALFLFL